MLQHSTKKPGCQTEILSYFRNAPDSGVTRPDQIAVIGDRLFTDVMMANMMGSWGVWLRDGVVEEKGLVSLRKLLIWLWDYGIDEAQFTRLEGRAATYLLRRGYSAPTPTSQFEG